jgi:hypothetical protein
LVSQKGKMNLFLATRRLARGREEDHLTEFFAAALEIDEPFRDAYTALIIAPFAEANHWAPPRIRFVETQKNFDGHGSCPDMTLTLEDGHIIACEHKLEAMETLAPLVDELPDPVPQLQRYLASLPIDGLAFVRSSLKPPDAWVLDHRKYLRPRNRQHYLWRDFFPLLEASEHPCSRWLREGFVSLGFTPAHPLVGDLMQPAVAANFAKLWSSTRADAHELGWHVGAGAVVELYLDREKATSASRVWICPRNEQLLVRATPASDAYVPEILSRFGAIAAGLTIGVSVESHIVRRIAGKTMVVDAWAPLRLVLGECSSGEQAETRLHDFVIPFVAGVS